MPYLVGGLVFLVLFLIVSGGASLLFLGWKLYGAYETIDRQHHIVEAYQDALKRPAVAMMTHEQIEVLASYLTPTKKEYVN